MKEKLNDTVKTNDLKGMIKGIVSELMQEMKDDIKQYLNDLKQNYDAKLLQKRCRQSKYWQSQIASASHKAKQNNRQYEKKNGERVEQNRNGILS